MEIATRWSSRTVDGLYFLYVQVAEKWRPLDLFCREPRKLTTREKRQVTQLLCGYHQRDTGLEQSAFESAKVLQPEGLG